MRRDRERRGMTLIEMLIVVVIVSMLALLSAPRFTALLQRSALRSARQQVEAMLATARASAIQKGRNATFWVSGQAVGVRVVINDAGTTTDVVPRQRLDSLYGVTLALAGSAPTSIVYTARGATSPRLASTAIFRFTAGTRKDSTCVAAVGHILGQACVQ